MKKNIYGIIVLIALLVSCTNNKDLATFSVNVDEDCQETDFFSDYSYVRLSDSEPMISQIKDVRLYSDKIYVLDKTEKILIFSKEGRFISTIDKLGHGANEYVEISDFDILDKSVYVLSSTLKTIFEYDENGNPLNKYELNDCYSGMRLMKPHVFLLASANCNHQKFNFLIYDSQKESYESRFVPFEKNESMTMDYYHPFVGREGDVWYVTNPFTTEIMELTEESAQPYRDYAFNTPEQIPDNVASFTFEQLDEMFTNKRVVRNISFFCATKEYEYIGYELFGDFGLSFHLTQVGNEGKAKTMMALNDINENFPYFSTPMSLSGSTFVSAMNAIQILSIEKGYNLNKFTSMGVKEENNPIIFFHTLK